MANLRLRRGIASEHQVVGQLIDAGFDVYRSVVDDQGIDGALRVQTAAGSVRYYDLQIKSARSWSDIRGAVSKLGLRPNTVLILFNSSSHECLWFDFEDVRQHFAQSGLPWGDVFLHKDAVSRFREEGRGELAQLLDRLSAEVTLGEAELPA